MQSPSDTKRVFVGCGGLDSSEMIVTRADLTAVAFS